MTDTDVNALIEQDHREFERLFDQLRQNHDERAEFASHLTMLLTAHSRAEESEVYPAAAKSGDADEVAHGIDEHLEADRLLAELAAQEPASAGFDRVLGELNRVVTHHIEEEEATVLQHIAERLSGERRDELGRAFMAMRGRYLDQQPEESGVPGDVGGS